jgi:signal transduction histidine kinase
MNFSEYIRGLNTYIIFTIGVVTLLIMGFVDYITGVELSFSVFYLIPIAFVAYYGSKFQGLFTAVLSAVSWLAADLSAIDRYSSHAIPYWNMLVRLGFFLVVLYLVDGLRNKNIELEEEVLSRTADLTKEIIEREKTASELHRKSEKLRQLVVRSQNIREEENTKIAREIHDELGQALTAIKIDIASTSKKYSNDKVLVERLYNATNMIDNLIKTIREISTRLRPRLLDQLGLLPAIEWQLKDIHSRTGLKYKLLSKEDDISLPASVSNGVFRIFQEAITNIVRHSGASYVVVRLDRDPQNRDFIKLEIIDNGNGFSQDYLDSTQCLGILGMKERSKILGGDLEVVSGEEWGTAVVLNFPINGLKELRND